MNDTKYIGLDVHQATMSGGGSGFCWEVGDGSCSGNEGRNDSPVYSRTTRKVAGDYIRFDPPDCLVAASGSTDSTD